MESIEQRIASLLSPPLGEMGYEVVEVHFSQGNKGQATLQVIVDREEPIGLNQIVEVSEKISALLDESDPIEKAYTLDVSSLGAEKPIALEKLGAHAGQYVHLHLSHPYKGENDLEGTLGKVDGENVELTIAIKAKKKTILLPRKDIDKARRAISF